MAPSRLHTWQSIGLWRKLSRLMKLNHLTAALTFGVREIARGWASERNRYAILGHLLRKTPGFIK
jgi:hypothetical protein